MVVKGRVTGNDTVLIMGASGGVGTALIQLCKLRGATAIAIASESKHDFVRELGADFVCSHDEHLIDALADHKITVYFDTVGGDYFPQLLEQLQVGGRYVTCGLTRCVALEGAAHGVSCNSISPGWVETNLAEGTIGRLAKIEGRTAAEYLFRGHKRELSPEENPATSRNRGTGCFPLPRRSIIWHYDGGHNRSG